MGTAKSFARAAGRLIDRKCVIVYELPRDSVVSMGTIFQYPRGIGYATTDYVNPDEIDEVPDSFLETYYLDRAHGAQQIDDKIIGIYRVRSKFLRGIDNEIGLF